MNNHHPVRKGPKNPERSFGISVGAVLCVIALALAWRGRIGRAEIVGAIGVFLLVFGAVAPRVLRVPSRIWWRFAIVLGAIMGRVWLTLLFALLLLPVSLAWRILGKDPLMRRRKDWPGWSPYPARYRDREHYLRMY
jgi:hypothetical protein